MLEENLFQIILMVVFLAGSAFFSAAETALMTLSKIRIKQLVESDVKGSKRIEKLLSEPNKLLSTILIGNNVVNIGASSLMTSLAIEAFGNTGVGIATGAMTLLILIFGEITPKSLAAENAEKISFLVAPFIAGLSFLLTPIIFVLSKITGGLVRLLGGKSTDHQPFITTEELKTLVSVGHTEGVLEDDTKDMIHNVFDFSDTHVDKVMVPRTDMVSIPMDTSYEELITIVRDTQYSRIPVYEETRDDIKGILYVKDLLSFDLHPGVQFDLKDYVREPHFTYEFKSTTKLFNEMRASRIHMMIVVDEYGGTAGIITLEDLIEEIVGEIEDEYDTYEDEVEVLGTDAYCVNGDLKVEDLNKLLDLDIEEDEFDTIAGFILSIINRIPEQGDLIDYEDYQFTIEQIERNRIEKVKITKKEDDTEKEHLDN